MNPEKTASRWFLVQVYKRSRWMFVTICVLVVAHLVPVFLGFEITPFYDWSMYARPQQQLGNYQLAVLRYNGKLYNPKHTWADHKHMLVTYTLGNYVRLATSGDTLPHDSHTARFVEQKRWDLKATIKNTSKGLENYPSWLAKYLSAQVGEPIGKLEIGLITVHYGHGNRVLATDSINLSTLER